MRQEPESLPVYTKILATFFFSLGFLVSGLGCANAEQAYVERVIDGDTVVLQDGTRVRLIGIDAPEIENRDYGHRGDPYGEEAKQVLKHMVEGKTVDLQDGPEKNDKYNRRLAYIYLPDQRPEHFLVNRNLIVVGAAAAYRKFPHPFLAEFIQIEEQSKKEKAGMWALRKKTPTWWQRLFGVKPL